ncbi:hypothetical protein ACOMHN_041096 [Nucella lapillus]
MWHSSCYGPVCSLYSTTCGTALPSAAVQYNMWPTSCYGPVCQLYITTCGTPLAMALSAGCTLQHVAHLLLWPCLLALQYNMWHSSSVCRLYITTCGTPLAMALSARSTLQHVAQLFRLPLYSTTCGTPLAMALSGGCTLQHVAHLLLWPCLPAVHYNMWHTSCYGPVCSLYITTWGTALPSAAVHYNMWHTSCYGPVCRLYITTCGTPLAMALSAGCTLQHVAHLLLWPCLLALHYNMGHSSSVCRCTLQHVAQLLLWPCLPAVHYMWHTSCYGPVCRLYISA